MNGPSAYGQVSGTWSGAGTAWSTTAGAVTIATSATGAMGPFQAGTLGCAGAYSTAAVDGGPSLVVRYTDFNQAGTLTFTFSQPVTDPVLHIDRLGGNVLTLSTSALLTIQTPTVTWTELSANGTHFNSSATTVHRTVSLVTTSMGECGAALSILLGGAASGSLRVNGTISSLTLGFSQALGAPIGNPGEELEIAWSGISQPPLALDDNFVINEDGALAASVAGNDTDADTPPAQLIWQVVNGGSAALNGNLLLSANGNLTYAPNGDFNGGVSFTYRVCDPSGACDTASVSIAVTPINDQPVAVDDVFLLNEDGSTANNVGTNDGDVETPPSGLTWSLINGGTAAAHGLLSVQPDGSFDYQPQTDYSGIVSFTYEVCDPSGACDQATVVLTIDPVNDAPVATDDGYAMNEDGILVVQVGNNDQDVDHSNAVLAWNLTDPGSAGANGVLALAPDGQLSFAPMANINGTFTCSYRVCDPNGACDTAVVTIAVGPVNDAPIALDDAWTMDEDGNASGTATGNDADPDDAAATLVWALLNGGTAAAGGTLSFQPDGSFTYAPMANASGVVWFTYQLCDPWGACDVATGTITITALNDPPVAVNDLFTMVEDGTLLATVAGNDADADDPAAVLVWSLVDGSTAEANGTLVLQPDGSFNYVPDLDFTGTVTFIYSVCDPSSACSTATATIIVGSDNDPPDAQDDGFVVQEDGVLAGDAGMNDSDLDGDPLVFALVNGGTATAHGVLVLDPSGTFTFTPFANVTGTCSFTYEACDPLGVCDVATATITITPLNDGPVAGDDLFTLDEDGTLLGAVVLNDVDIDDLPAQLTWSMVSGGSADANGALLLNADGTFAFVPDPNVNGTFTFQYELCDDDGVCDIATVTVQVVPINDAPTASDDLFSIPEDDALSATVAANDGDVDHPGLLTWTVLNGGTAAANGVLVLLPDGSFTFTPAADASGAFWFTYEVCDPLGLCATATVSLDVQPVNDPPVAVDDLFILDEESSMGAFVGANDQDVDDALLTFALLDSGSAGTAGVLVFGADGNFTFTGAVDATGTFSFIYAICDGSICDTATVTLELLPINDPPNAADDTYLLLEDAVLAAVVSTNDGDAEADPLIWSLVDGGTATANGLLALAPDGSFSYSPFTDFNGVVWFIYSTCDDAPSCDPATVTITVVPVNDAPVAVDDTFTMQEDSVLDATVAPNDSDVDHTLAQLVWSVADSGSAAANGSLTFHADGTFNYAPFAGTNGTVSFTYAVCDVGPLCDTALVTITITPVPDDPQITDGGIAVDTLWITTVEDVPLDFCIVAVDADGDSLELTAVLAGPSNGNATGIGDGDLCLTYTPAADFNGGDGFAVVVCDDGGACDTAWVVVTVTPVNDPPVAMDDTFTMDEDNTLNATAASNDSDADHATANLVWTLVDAGTAGLNGTLLLNNDGTFSYTPQAAYNGTVSFTYSLCDPEPLCDTAVVTITVNAVPDDPQITDGGIAVDTLWITTVEDVPVDLCVQATDDDGDPLEAAATTGGPANGTVSGTGDGDLCLTYTPAADFSGGDGFAVVVCDDGGACDTAWVVVTVTPVNDPPVAMDDTFTMDEDNTLNATAASNDSDVDHATADLVWNLVDAGTAGLNGTLLLNNDGTFSYTPQAAYNGTVSFTYSLCDPEPLCDTAVVTITVNAVPDDPQITDGGIAVDTLWITTVEDVPVDLCVQATDDDGDPLEAAATTGGPANGTVSGTGDGDLCLTYTPAADFSGGDGFAVVVCDDGGACDTAWVVVNVTPVNDPPVAMDDTFTMDEDNTLNATAASNDSDADHGTADLVWTLVDAGTAGLNGALLLNNDGTFSYTPQAAYNGIVSFTYSLCDPEPLCDTAVVTITINAIPDDPQITDGGIAVDTLWITTAEDVPLDLCIVAVDADGDSLELTAVLAGPSNGNATGIGDGDLCVTYTPAADFNGGDGFAVVVCDDGGACDTAWVVVTVTPVNDPPLATDDAAATPQDTPVIIDVLANDSDPEGDPLTVASATAQNGQVVINGDGTLTYTPDPLFCGVDTITYTVCDSGGSCDSAIVIVDVPCPPDQPPVAVDDTASTPQDTPVIIDVLANDSDPEGDPLTVTSATAQNGQVVINGDGTLTYTPDPLFCGADTITYTVCDDGGSCDSAVVVIDVNDCAEPLTIPGGFSANGDGIGDVWHIRGLEDYPGAGVRIFNRWGNEVFSAQPFANDWDGTSNAGLGGGGPLPSGTYWYVFDPGNGRDAERTGYLYIER